MPTKLSGRRVVSSKGEIVDFDLLEMKQKMAGASKPLEVKKREDFIDSKLRRGAKSSVEALKAQAEANKMAREKAAAPIVPPVDPPVAPSKIILTAPFNEIKETEPPSPKE